MNQVMVLVFFRRLMNHREVSQWKTAICIINVDGTGFRQLTDGTHTDFQSDMDSRRIEHSDLESTRVQRES